MTNIYELVEKKLSQTVRTENLYCLEILLQCADILGMERPQGKQKLRKLKKKAEEVGINLVKILNMEIGEEHELNILLDQSLRNAERYGLRGQLIDTCMLLKNTRDKLCKEMTVRFEEEDDEDVLYYIYIYIYIIYIIIYVVGGFISNRRSAGCI